MTGPALTYVIRAGTSADGTNWWAVVGYADDVPMGADCHWLSLELAEQAKARYEAEAKAGT